MANMHNIYKDSKEAMIVAEMVRSHSFLLSYNATTENIHLKLFETVKNMHRSSAENKQESRAYHGVCKNYQKILLTITKHNQRSNLALIRMAKFSCNKNLEVQAHF